MSPHGHIRLAKYHPAKFRLALSCLAVLIALSSLLPATAQAQTILPVVIKLPPSFLGSAPGPVSSTKAAALKQAGAIKQMVERPAAAPQMAALRNAEVRATELRGLLPHQYDHHYFRLEATQPEGAFAVTLVVEPATVLVDDAVNFVVLTAEGMKKLLAGVDPLVVKTALGSPFVFDQVGNRLTALVPGNAESDYTVLVYNNGKLPATYQLQVMGGVLVDQAGQTFSAVKVGAARRAAAVELPVSGMLHRVVNRRVPGAQDATLVARHEGIVKRMGLAAVTPAHSGTALRQILPESVSARRVSGAIENFQDRHYLNLAADTGGGDITLTLRYRSDGGVPTHLNFWVMTQDGVRQLVQGGLAQELNLATGLPVAGEAGVYQTRLRMAENMLYTVVVFSEGMVEADYTLAVQGGILVDRYGQTREAQAAEMEVLALATK
jgi:hypothetical protein